MNADLDTAAPQKPPRDPVEGWLGALGAGELSLEDARARIVELCARDREASWAALSWLDQYHRRRVIDRDTYLDLKRSVTAVAMSGAARGAAARQPSSPDTGTPATGHAPAPATGGTPAIVAAPPAVATRPATLARTTAIAPSAAPAPAPRRLAPGTTLAGRYELEAEIGQGALAVVFRARDRERRGIDGLSDLVAVKALRHDLDARDGALEILRRECFRTQALSHPNIVDVYGWERDGELRFVTLELIEGQSLEDLLSDLGPRRVRHEHALAIVQAAGAALACAHARGMVHGDLKPANVMIGVDGHVRVLGFGGAAPDPGAPSYEVDGLRMVTPRYASPDVLAGLHAVAADDVFSLACIACELLCGAVPFPDGADNRAQRRRAKLRKPRGLHRRDWPLLRKALAPERNKRPTSVTEWLAGFREDKPAAVPALRELVDHARRPPRFGPLQGLLTAALAGMALLFALPEPRTAIVESLRSLFAPAATPGEDAAPVPAITDDREVAAAVPVATPAAEPANETPAPAASTPEPPSAATPVAAPVAAPVATRPSVPLAAAPRAAATTPAATVPNDAPSAVLDRPERPFVGMVADTVAAREGNGAVRIPVQRFGGLSRGLEFTWWTESGSARPGADYGDLDTQTARFAPGAARVTLVVPLVDDAVIEPPESFSVRIRVDRPGADPGFAASSVTIIDDDAEAAAAPDEAEATPGE